MHEYSIVSSLLERVEAECARHGATAVHKLHVRIGESSGVEPKLLATAFQTFRERTVCAGAELEIERVPCAWSCPKCGAAIPSGGLLRCGPCNTPARMDAGDEIVLARIELEVADHV